MQEFFINNREKLNERITDKDLVVLFSGTAPKSTADSYYNFLADKNFYYFTGLNKENFALCMYRESGVINSVLFIEKANYDMEKWHGRKLKSEAATEVSAIKDVKFIEDLNNYISSRIYNDKTNSVYLDLHKLSWDQEDSISQKFSVELKKRYTFLDIKTIHQVVSDFRTIKTDYEIEMMQKAIDITRDGLKDIMKVLEPGVFEYQLESTFNHSIKMNGADRNSFPTIAASGGDGVILHYVENDKKIEDDVLVLLDLGAQYKEYAADISRTYPSNGKFSSRQKEIYDIVLKAQAATIEIMKPGAKFSLLNETCKKVLAEELTSIGLIKTEYELSKYYYHGVSHFLGLDVHDLGDRDIVLEEGMVLTVEPGLYIAEEQIGIRIEDDILITKDGNRNLSIDIVKTTEGIESFMANL
ncbi:MAG: aminopeptidase P N-terminal domain-containing protein [Acidaminobacteraceae bacterium]